ncbi:hypothetical protein HNI00_14155 [Thermoleptolyngbya oregonensis NK1-22]|uniref:Uncharacterized protein n=1 Tax=Thermoleptolyngbya oregonensis NK1-22 TaxID=2547457 RepID=A0AA96Y625_9CYAN|nr:hypothetical protein [Thermoleptolyngbya oregonensis]WOB44166.1 hypothetical protein HNI00_14155 [Thermoleptolyngbya oregonensis NK1-22]
MGDSRSDPYGNRAQVCPAAPTTLRDGSEPGLDLAFPDLSIPVEMLL